jgi:hypothetical protein
MRRVGKGEIECGASCAGSATKHIGDVLVPLQRHADENLRILVPQRNVVVAHGRVGFDLA